MAELTLDQQKALAMANARKRAAQKDDSDDFGYSGALRNIRETQFPDMNDQQWAEYSSKVLAPQGLTGLSQHGGSMGLNDEIGALVGATGSAARKLFTGEGPGFGEAYGDYKELENARRDLGREQQGGLGVGAEILGGAAAIGSAPQKITSAVTPLWQQAVKSGSQGALLGGIYGGAAADENRVQEAVKGGAIGGVVGAAVPYVISGVSKAYKNVTDAIASRNAAKQTGMSPEAARFLQETIGVDDALSPIGAARMSSAGNEAMLADAGQSAKNALDTAVQSSGKAGNIARTAVDSRVSRDSKAITSVLDDVLGAPQGINTTRSAIRTSSAPARADAYDDAYRSLIDYNTTDGQEILSLLKRAPAEAKALAHKMMRTAGVPVPKPLPKGMIDLPEVQELDYITRALKQMATSGEGQGALGAQTDIGGLYSSLTKSIRNATKSASPAYAKALETASDPIRRSQAVLNGSKLLRSNTTREMVADWVEGASGPEKAAIAQGVRSNIDDVLANVKRTVMDGDVQAREALKALKELSSRASRDKITLVVGKDKASKLFSEIDRATKSFELRASIADNSKTFMRQEMSRRVKDISSPTGPVATLAKGEPVNASKRAIQSLTGMTPESALTKQDAIYSEVAEALTGRGNKAVDALYNMQQLAKKTGSSQNVVDALMLAGQKVSAPSSIVASQLLGPRQ